MNRRLYRCRHDRRLAGVSAGMAEYFDADPTIVRLLWFVSIFVTGGLSILLYLVMAIIVPIEPLTDMEATQLAALPEGHRHAARGEGTGRLATFFGVALILFGGLALVDAFLPSWQDSWRYLAPAFIVGIGALLVVRRHAPRDERIGGVDRLDRHVIEAVVLVTGLLLILAGLASARIPGGASFARPGIARSPLRAFLLSPIHPTTWYANGAIIVGLFVGTFAFVTVVALVSTGLTVLLAGIGVVLIALAIEGSRLVARVERWRVFVGEVDRPIPHPYRPLRGGILDILRAEFADEARWRDVLYVAVNLPLTIIEFLVVGIAWALALVSLTLPLWIERLPSVPVAIVELAWLGPVAGVVLLFVAASLSQLVLALHRQVVAGLLCTSESRELRRQVETLRESRSAVLDVEASELRRIERDLHDGAQPRLVRLSIDLGLASERIDTDPEGAKELVREGQEQARAALAEIRQLVRGIAPAILLDRGLVPAIESITSLGADPDRGDQRARAR